MSPSRISTLLVVGFVVAPAAARADEWSGCAAADLAIVIPSCSRIIDAGGEPATRMAVAYYNRATAYFKQGQAGLALPDFDKSIGLNDKDADALFNRGLLLVKQGAFDRAYADFDAVLKLTPDYAGAHFYRGLADHGRGDFAGAIADYDAHLKSNAQDAEGYFNRGVARADLKDDAGALTDYDKALSLNRAYADAYVNRGNIYRRNKAFDQAIADYASAIELDPRIPEAYANRAGAYADRGDNEKAAADLEALLKLNPPKQLADFAREALSRLTPGAPSANKGAASVATPASQPAKAQERNYCLSDDPATAIAACTQTINAANESAEQIAKAHHNRGMAYLDLGRTPTAIDDFTKAITLSPDFALPYYARGNAYYQLDQNEKALRDYDKYVALAPKDAKGYAGRALTLHELGRAKQAIDDFEGAIFLAPDYALAYFGRGQIRTEERKYNLAVDDFDKALALDPKDAVAMRYRGYAQEMRGDRGKAAIDYKQTLALNPSKLTEQRAYEGLARIKGARPQADKKAMKDCDSGNVDFIFHGCSNIAEDEAAPPDNRARALIIRGLLYARLDEFARAIADFTEAIKAGGVNLAAAYSDRGSTYAEIKQFDAAIKDFDEAIRLSPEDAGNHVNRALALENVGRTQEALSDFQRALELSPPSSLAATASQGVKRLAATTPSKSGPSFFNEAELCSGSDPDLVISNCALVIGNTAYPAKDRAGAYLNRGTAWNNKGDLAKAIEDYSHAIELDPGFALAYTNRGAMYVNQKDDERALADFQKAIALDEKSAAFAYAGRGGIFERRGDRDAANADYEKALSLKPGPVAASLATEGRQRLIDTAKRVGDEEAEDCASADPQRFARGCSKIISNKALSSQMRVAALMTRASHYLDANDLQHAREDYAAALALNPGYGLAYGLRGYVSLLRRDYPAAITDLTRSVELGTYADGHKHLGMALEGAGDFKLALQELDSALLTTPNDAEALFHRGAVRQRLGQVDDARHDYESSLASGPSETTRRDVEEALKRLDASPLPRSSAAPSRR
ncbi:tetratricopeptide repeat protein [Hyphomicrobium sp. NDB2Meth4]|uniref:tetratricopeptide repeat protein n=1 Tax=Hyphomicrobium sp. NDB2Meth4 TaxID=1892846 RepID=UPI0009FA1996|nr:tetratricopeptide repeat protein [Hyphomicrobium sp. NDB2Meth4]